MTARLATVLAAAVAAVSAPAQDRIVVASKNFTESGVLGELMAQTIEAYTDLEVVRRFDLGGTMICWGALQQGEIDVYADYTGTAWAIVLKERGRIADPLRAYFHVRQRYLELYDVHWLDPFGLENSYALAMREDHADELGIRSISDLIPHQEQLRGGFSVEFGDREDGWKGLAEAYGLQLGDVRTLEHGLAYAAIQSGAIDVTDAYTTDGKLLRYRLRVLDDDRDFFPPYHAAPLVRGAVLQAHPELGEALGRLSFRVPNEMAQALNYLVEAEGETVAAAARAFLEREGIVTGVSAAAAKARARLDAILAERPEPGGVRKPRTGFLALMQQRAGVTAWLVLEHVGLTLIAVLLAALVAIPLGIACTRHARLRHVALGFASIVQTVPSLALLAFMIPFLGINGRAAIAALFLYTLLPILRNTYTGIAGVDPSLVDAATGMGLRPAQVLRHVQLPLAMRTIMAGVRTATVITIGFATLAAFIGAGGLGAPIVRGLYLNDPNLILSGAIPAAILAGAAEFGLGRLERALQPRTSSAG